MEADHLIHLLNVRIEEGGVAAIPALFTSSVMPAFVRSVVSIRARSALSFRSAAIVWTYRHVSSFKRWARAASRLRSRAARIRS